jgi:hypothetical protein
LTTVLDLQPNEQQEFVKRKGQPSIYSHGAGRLTALR